MRWKDGPVQRSETPDQLYLNMMLSYMLRDTTWLWNLLLNERERMYYMGWKVPEFLMKTSVFWAKLYLFLNIVAFEGDTLGIAIFQHFDVLSVVRNVQVFEICLSFRDDFLIRCESLPLEPLEVWEQIIVAGDQGYSGEYGWATNSNRNWSNLAIAFKDVCDVALSWWYRMKAKVTPLNDCSL